MGFSGSGICVTAIDRDSGFQGKMGARFGMENMEWGTPSGVQDGGKVWVGITGIKNPAAGN